MTTPADPRLGTRLAGYQIQALLGRGGMGVVYLAEQTGHRAGIETVRVALHRAGFVCKRPRWVLSRKAQAQPGWAKNG